MKCNIQDVLEIDLPDSMADSVDIFNNEWDLETGQAWEMNNFIKLTKDKKTLWDIGGHIGFFSFVFLINNNDNRSKNIRCFEPSPWNNDTFRKIVDHNAADTRYDNLKLFSLLVGEKDDEKNFIIEQEAKTMAILYERDDPFYRVETLDDTPWAEKEKIRMQPLDKYWFHCIEEKDSIADTVKIDVEGYEYRVLQGATNFFNQIRPLLFLEVHPHLLNMYNNTILNLYDIVTKEIKYNFFDNKLGLIKSKDEYIKLFSNKEEIRLVCLPQEEGVERIDA
jgi:FkbM family methyltransferase